MRRLVISTVGTSLLTNQIDNEFESDWSSRLQETANLTEDEINRYHQDVVDIISQLKERAERTLNEGNIAEIREASAELNGIYGLYEDNLEAGKKDIHWLIATDTAQGKVTAEIVKNFLLKKNLSADCYYPQELSTFSTEKFTNGIDELLQWMDTIIPNYQKSEYSICFNLVGGFKALQGYANTIGMIYQIDEIIYIFEGSSEIITIPRLPIQIDKSVIKPVQFALMAAKVGFWVPMSELEGIPKTLLFIVDDKATLSNWGRLIWNKCKSEFLTKELLEFPKLIYKYELQNQQRNWIKNDYKLPNITSEKKLELHEVFAEVSATLVKFNGDTTKFDPRLKFGRYTGERICEGGVTKNQIDHFYIKNTGYRVSCIAKEGKLYLRHYGEHDYVNNNP
jgi:putative CRISPR-associated protein (TIGR02619 family)